jgi:hypothetical protein
MSFNEKLLDALFARILHTLVKIIDALDHLVNHPNFLVDFFLDG